MKKSASLLLFASVLLAATAKAQTFAMAELERLLPLSLEELMAIPVTISTSTKQKLSKAPSVVSVITEDDIKATGTTNLMEILQSVPGLYVKTNLFGFKPLITFRGASGANVLLMVNGAPMKDLVWTPGIFWKGIPASQIERIEIIRGPGSALFGSDASAGVINVITKTAGKIAQSGVGLRAGSFDTQQAWLQHGARWNGLDIAFTAELSHTDGHDPFIARARDNTQGHARYGWGNEDIHFSLAGERWRLLLDHTRHRDVEIGLTGAAVLDPQTRAHDSLDSLALLYADPAFAQDWELNGELRLRNMEYSSGNGFFEGIPGYALHKRESATERRNSFELSAVYHGLRNHALRFCGGAVVQELTAFEQVFDGVPKVIDTGGSYTFLDLATNNPLQSAPKTRRNHYFFLQDVWSLSPDWELTAGLRHDHYSDFGSTLNPRLALVWQTTERLTTKLLYGQAFRAPSYLERYMTTAANPPNPTLQPEKSRTWELSFSWLAQRDLRLGANVYRFDRRDVIAPNPQPSGQFANYPRFLTRGIELEAQWQATPALRLAANYSQMKNEDVSFPLRDLSIPLKQAYFRLDWNFLPKWHWNVQAHWFGDRPLPPGDKRLPGKTGAFTLASTTLNYTHDKHWSFAASIRNLFDTAAREYSHTSLYYNLPLPGRNFFAELRYRF